MTPATEQTKRGSKLRKETNFETGVLTMKFQTSPETVKTYSVAELPEPMQKAAAVHGLSQKLGDSVASKDINAADAVGTVDNLWNQLLSGKWEKESDGIGPNEGILTEALQRYIAANVPGADATAAVAAFTPEQRKAFRATDEIKALMLTIQQERLAAKPKPEKPETNAAALLAQLLAPAQPTA